MKTKITLVTGEEVILDASVAEVIEKTTNSHGQVYHDYMQINDDTWITPAHIVKLERIKEK